MAPGATASARQSRQSPGAGSRPAPSGAVGRYLPPRRHLRDRVRVCPTSPTTSTSAGQLAGEPQEVLRSPADADHSETACHGRHASPKTRCRLMAEAPRGARRRPATGRARRTDAACGLRWSQSSLRGSRRAVRKEAKVGDRLTFLGHSTVLIDLDGVRVLYGSPCSATSRPEPSGARCRWSPRDAGGLSASSSATVIWTTWTSPLCELFRASRRSSFPVGLGRVVSRRRTGRSRECGPAIASRWVVWRWRPFMPSTAPPVTFTSAEEALGLLIVGSH